MRVNSAIETEVLATKLAKLTTSDIKKNHASMVCCTFLDAQATNVRRGTLRHQTCSLSVCVGTPLRLLQEFCKIRYQFVGSTETEFKLHLTLNSSLPHLKWYRWKIEMGN